MMTQSQIERFQSKVKKGAADGCWIWQAGKSRCGYGTFYMGKTVRANRVAWQIENGPIPKGLHILHRCDNPPCVNPNHLFLGTHKENMIDMMTKGRASRLRGEQKGNCVLTEEKVLCIKALLWFGIPIRMIAKNFGIGKGTVGRIKEGSSWAWLKEPFV